MLWTVLGTRDILVRIRMRIPEAQKHTDPDSDHWYTVFTSFFKDKKSLRSYNTVEIKVFLTIFAWCWKDPEPDPYLWLMDADPGGQKHTDPHADSEHWYIYIILQRQTVIKKLQNSRNQGFSYNFCWMMEGSGTRSGSVTNGSGCVSRGPKTYGSGYGFGTLIHLHHSSKIKSQ